jgi:membrane-anchored protein YejM (alkaline phosphatase superfamily)
MSSALDKRPATTSESGNDSAMPPPKHIGRSPLHRWFLSPRRPELLRWSFGFMSAAALVCILGGLRYFAVYQFPREPLAILYTIAAFTSHFASFFLGLWLAVIFPAVCIAPVKKVVVPLSIMVASAVVTLVLLDSQIYTAHRIHFTFLTIKIFGIQTWGFGILYFVILAVFYTFLSRMIWARHIVRRRKVHPAPVIAGVVGALLFTHLTHIVADARGYVPVTRFTSILPLFYPSTAKKKMVKLGLADISGRRAISAPSGAASGFHYPSAPLAFAPHQPPLNVLILAVDDMRADLLDEDKTPHCMRFARESGIRFTDHWSGGNSTKMGMFSLFYGIPPTYQQFVEANKIPPVLMDRLLGQGYAAGIFSSYNLYRPAGLDVTAFVKIRDLRLETKISGPGISYRKDSAVVQEWKEWLDRKPAGKPFFGFVFLDALCSRTFPPSYKSLLRPDGNEAERQKGLRQYMVSIRYVDSLCGVVFDDLAARNLLDRTVVVFTSDHGEEFDDNRLGFNGHGSAYSDYQLRVPLIVHWPGKEPGIRTHRTSHNDIVASLVGEALGCTNPPGAYSSGSGLFLGKPWEWFIAGSYFNFAVIEPEQVTIQFPGGYYEVRDRAYRMLKNSSITPNIAAALSEMGRFYR